MAGFQVGGLFQFTVILLFFVIFFSIINLKEYFKSIIKHLRIKDKNISILEFFNVYLINNMQNGLITVDEDFIISFWNKAAERIVGKKYVEVVSKSLNDIYPRLCKYCTEEVSEHVEIWENINGKNICLTIKASPIIVNQDYVGNILVFEDITKFKENQRNSEQTRRLAAIGRLAAALAHELRNPLASISGSVEMLKDESVDPGDYKRLLEIIIREIDGLDILISELLDFVKPITLKRKEYNLSKLIQETISLINFEKKIKIRTELDDSILYSCDPNKLKQVFLNILKNAFDILNEDVGFINVSMKYTSEKKIIILFEDNGPGISKENMEKIFEPFFTTKERGTGLGLATCHKVLEMHGGGIEVGSETGKTQFKITL